MHVRLSSLKPTDAEAVLATEDEATVPWLNGARRTATGIATYIEYLDQRAAQGATKRAYGIVVHEGLVGTIEFDADPTDDLDVAPGDVNIAYGVAPWVRGRGIASHAVELVCGIIRAHRIGERAVIQTSPRNPASIRVAEKAGFEQLNLDAASAQSRRAYGRSPHVIYVRPLS